MFLRLEIPLITQTRGSHHCTKFKLNYDTKIYNYKSIYTFVILQKFLHALSKIITFYKKLS